MVDDDPVVRRARVSVVMMVMAMTVPVMVVVMWMKMMHEVWVMMMMMTVVRALCVDHANSEQKNNNAHRECSPHSVLQIFKLFDRS